MQRFQDIKAWQRSHQLTLDIYRLSSVLPDSERYGLISQIRRAAASVPTNIAEGSKRRTAQEYARFLNFAEASLAELEYLLLLSRDLGYVTRPAVEKPLRETGEIARMLNALRSRVARLPHPNHSWAPG